MIIKNNAFFGFIIPAGISLIAVRGFKASNFLSIYLLKAMAALRAVAMHNKTSKNNFSEKVNSCCNANVNPMHAKGSAKIV
jgi:hypothetical protein